MKNRAHPATKLKLSKETLRDLAENKLRNVAGGISTQPIPDSCSYTATDYTCTHYAVCSCFC